MSDEKLLFISMPDSTAEELHQLRLVLTEALEGNNLGYAVVMINREWNTITREELDEIIRGLSEKAKDHE